MRSALFIFILCVSSLSHARPVSCTCRSGGQFDAQDNTTRERAHGFCDLDDTFPPYVTTPEHLDE